MSSGWVLVSPAEWEVVRLALRSAQFALGGPPDGLGREEMEGARALAGPLVLLALGASETVEERRKADEGGR